MNLVNNISGKNIKIVNKFTGEIIEECNKKCFFCMRLIPFKDPRGNIIKYKPSNKAGETNTLYFYNSIENHKEGFLWIAYCPMCGRDLNYTKVEENV